LLTKKQKKQIISISKETIFPPEEIEAAWETMGKPTMGIIKRVAFLATQINVSVLWLASKIKYIEERLKECQKEK